MTTATAQRKKASVDKYYQRSPENMTKFQLMYWSNRRQIKPWYFLAPVLAALLFIAGWPLARTIYFGFTDTNLSYLNEGSWIGLENYYELATDPSWWGCVRNTTFFTAVFSLLQMFVVWKCYGGMHNFGKENKLHGN